MDKMEYAIDGGLVWLTNVSSRIACSVCSQILALNNNGSLLVKSFVTLLDFNSDTLTVKCGTCKHFNTVRLKKNHKKMDKCLLTI